MTDDLTTQAASPTNRPRSVLAMRLLVGLAVAVLAVGAASAVHLGRTPSVDASTMHAVAPTLAPAPPGGEPDRLGASTPTSRIDDGWAADVAAATGIPERALRAYATADLAVAAEQPGCEIGWNTIAAIGAIESGHGTHAGAVLDADGYPRPAIRGPSLDGREFAAIADTDSGVWDGDHEWDRAVGPMQFIPDTWQTWGADGNTDGAADPNQIDDAALATARYLCHSGPMSTAEEWRAAVYSYNHVEAYVNEVAGMANAYASRQAGE
ncbi:murein transglycosylase [Agromyces badenianii]|nr:murein transglycosylase [Agromyces badenianii]